MPIKKINDVDPVIRLKGKIVMYTKDMMEYFPATSKIEIGDIIVGETEKAIFTVNRAILRAFYKRIDKMYDNWQDKCKNHYDRESITYSNIIPYGDRKNKKQYKVIDPHGNNKDVNNPMHEDYHIHNPTEYPVRVGSSFIKLNHLN